MSNDSRLSGRRSRWIVLAACLIVTAGASGAARAAEAGNHVSAFTAGSVQPVELRITPARLVRVRQRGLPGVREMIRVELINHGDVPVLLVEPGDGSSCGWRTPVVRWRIEGPDGPVEKRRFARCGNINHLRPDEVFELAPGESRVLGRWLPGPRLYEPGRYTAVLTYEHDPELEWKGIAMGTHDPDAMRRIRESSPCVLESNPLEITVLAAFEIGE